MDVYGLSEGFESFVDGLCVLLLFRSPNLGIRLIENLSKP